MLLKLRLPVDGELNIDGGGSFKQLYAIDLAGYNYIRERWLETICFSS